MPEESSTSSIEDSMMSHDPPTQSQSGLSPQPFKSTLSKSVQIQEDDQRFPRFTKQDEMQLFNDPDSEFFDEPPIEKSKIGDKVEGEQNQSSAILDEQSHLASTQHDSPVKATSYFQST